MHAAEANTEYRHPLLTRRDTVKRVGVVVITTDKGLCGGLNTNVLRLVLNQHKEWTAKGIEVDYCAIGGKGFGFISRMGGKVVSQVVQLRRPAGARTPDRAGQDADRRLPRGADRRGARVRTRASSTR